MVTETGKMEDSDSGLPHTPFHFSSHCDTSKTLLPFLCYLLCICSLGNFQKEIKIYAKNSLTSFKVLVKVNIIF